VLLVVQSIRGALRLVGRERSWKWLVLLLLALLVAGFEATGAMMIYALVGLIAMDGSGLSLPVIGDLTQLFPDLSLRTLRIGAASLVGGFFLARSVVIVAAEYVQARVVQNAGAQVANRLVEGYLAMPYIFFAQRNSSELVRNAFDSSQRLVSEVLRPLVTIVAETVMVLGLTLVLLTVSPAATGLGILVLGPVIWLLLRVIQPRLKRLGRSSQRARKDALRALQHALGGFRDIRLLSRERYFAASFRRQRHELARNEYIKMTLAALPRALIETALIILIVTVFMVALLAGEGLDVVVSTLGVFAYVGLRLQPSLRQIVSNLNSLRFGSAVLDDLEEDHDRLAEEALADRSRVHLGNEVFSDTIEFQNVSFAYPPGGTFALRDVDVRIRRGEFIGICGPTGGGKSTLIDLLIGLLEPTEGRVLIDGEDLRGREHWWQQQLGVVSQNIFLIDESLRRNVALGRSEDKVDEEALRRALSRSQLDDVVSQLPEGLDTVVGERGIKLSGGQRQRVAIARALYREPSVIVFDEGTSALDAATEAALVAALDELKTGRTLITVAHRIATVRHADRILVVSGGQVAASGTYDELQQDSQLFRSIAR
jgi:ATP-binding cassette, subfamily B, bacterial PglK